ncbi:His-Xaa-Ser system radical SAM maturase HxsB [Bradyrhizobium elkanii]|uniref:His-Xaa-Ser system radical SAM maturase HxsB n=1 Tax=Bradyrhizobium TaxID=374 RepID=UPI0021680276|nr:MULTISPECIES: His-Xaa-Ser system radical SAM maturase HxsB [Bradyrhizobium]MCS3929001.1 His-Xaa-Ser system radical SAM maturase HxsB [Bradyrhizobium elkanii]MCS3969557.1 His-Xaa-Ser system radical SAM maturase HxsB [Bradyrhizobium japonicum]
MIGGAQPVGASDRYELLPFRFARLPGAPREILVTSEAGEFAFVSPDDLGALAEGRSLSEQGADELEAIQVIRRGASDLPFRLLATKLRTRKSFLRGGPKLHIFVVTLRCDHSCRYCQVSRVSDQAGCFDMSEDTAEAAIDRLFDAPGTELTVEFQGGEPLLAFARIRHIVETIARRNEAHRRQIRYTITSTLHHLSDDILAFLQQHQFHVSTSLDGGAETHDSNRPLPGRNSHARTLEGIARVREALGEDRLCALTTLTAKSLESPEAIVDEYVRLGFRAIFLRPLSPFGFAAKAEGRIGYSAEQYLAFYARALEHIFRLNRAGTPIVEVYASLLLGSMLTPFPSGYVDLRSPVGAGFGTMVYNYDGGVFASDEGRMLAEMGIQALRLGSVHDRYADLIASDAMQLLAGAGLAEALPGCSDCAFVHYCGPDPAGSLATSGDPVGHRAFSEHCKRHTGLFNLLFAKLASGDASTRRICEEWAFGRPALEVA